MKGIGWRIAELWPFEIFQKCVNGPWGRSSVVVRSSIFILLTLISYTPLSLRYGRSARGVKIWEPHSAGPISTKSGNVVGFDHVIRPIQSHFGFNIFRGFRSTRGQNFRFPTDFAGHRYNSVASIAQPVSTIAFKAAFALNALNACCNISYHSACIESSVGLYLTITCRWAGSCGALVLFATG